MKKLMIIVSLMIGFGFLLAATTVPAEAGRHDRDRDKNYRVHYNSYDRGFTNGYRDGRQNRGWSCRKNNRPYREGYANGYRDGRQAWEMAQRRHYRNRRPLPLPPRPPVVIVRIPFLFWGWGN